MKRMSVLFTIFFAFTVPAASFAADHDNMNMEHGGMMALGKLAHEEVVDGVKATFKVIDIQKKMKEMGMMETHHIMVVFTDSNTGKMLSGGEVKIKVITPDKTEQVQDLMRMEGGFGTDFTMPKLGKYGVMCKFKLKDRKVGSIKFWYTVK
jgi:hypothetical protein